MKSLLLFFMLASLPNMIHAQTANKVTFAYDQSGNRVGRTVTFSTLRSAKAASGSSEETKETFFSEMLSEHTVKIYPNPTKGQLAVEILSNGTTPSSKISLYDGKGQVVFSAVPTSSQTAIDISENPSGLYIMIIEINGEKTTWKIIKED